MKTFKTIKTIKKTFEKISFANIMIFMTAVNTANSLLYNIDAVFGWTIAFILAMALHVSEEIIKKQHKLIKEQEAALRKEAKISENTDDRCIQLLMQAASRGFFDNGNCFTPIAGWDRGAYFRHRYSDIVWNYRYDRDTDSLRIPAIGVRDNLSLGTVAIYQNDEWAEVEKIHSE